MWWDVAAAVGVTRHGLRRCEVTSCTRVGLSIFTFLRALRVHNRLDLARLAWEREVRIGSAGKVSRVPKVGVITTLTPLFRRATPA